MQNGQRRISLRRENGRYRGRNMNVKIYTDGAARGNPDGPGGFGTVLEYVDSVSYTHLDVYKRQIQKYLEMKRGTK